MSLNPYAPPQSLDSPLQASSDFVETRRKYIGHEASIRSVGVLFFLGAFFLLLAGVAALLDRSETIEVRIAVAVALIGIGYIQFRVARGLRRLKSGAKVPAGIMAGIGLLAFPLGTIFNAYILYLLFSEKGKMVFSERYQEIVAATPQVKYRTSRFLKVLLLLLALGFLALVLAAIL